MLFFVLLGVVMIVLGALLCAGGEMFETLGRLLRMAGGNIDPERGLHAMWYGVLLMLAGAGIIYLTMTLWK